jgi:hypothetical protein
MPGSLEVSFNSPQCGWMSIGFEGGGREFHTTTAHTPHDLALSELLAILTDLLDPSSEQTEYTLQWNRDPEAFDFRFVRTRGEVTLEIYQYPTDERDPATRDLEFSYTGPIADVCNAFAATFDQLYADRDTDEFEFNWRQPFPLAAFERFKGQLELTRLANQHA